MQFKLKPLVATVASALALGMGSAYAASDNTTAAGQNAATTGSATTQSSQSSVTTTAPGFTPPAAQSSVTTQSAATQSMADARASKLIGMKVRNQQGESLGDINDLAMDVTTNRVHYAIVGRGGILGMGEKEIAVPISRFTVASGGDGLLLDMTDQQLKDAPDLGRDRGNWNDARRWSDVGQYYHQTLGMPADGMSSSGYHRASKVIGMDVVDASGKKIGDIDDVVVDLSSGNVHYAVLEFDRAWNPVDKLVALPMSSFSPRGDKDELALNMTREQVANAPSFDENQWPSLTDGSFRNSVMAFGAADRDRNTVGMDAQSGSTASTTATSPHGTPSSAADTSSATTMPSDASTATAPAGNPQTGAAGTSSAVTVPSDTSAATAPGASPQTDATGTSSTVTVPADTSTATAPGASPQTGTTGMANFEGAAGGQSGNQASSATPGSSGATDSSSVTASGSADMTAGATGSTSATSPTASTTGGATSGTSAGTSSDTASTTSSTDSATAGTTTGTTSGATSTPSTTADSSTSTGTTAQSGQSSETLGMDNQNRSGAPGASGTAPGAAQSEAARSGANAQSQGTPMIGEAEFKRLDTDGDGRLSRQEASGDSRLSQSFSEADRDGDGYITRDELRGNATSPGRSDNRSGMNDGTASGAGTMSAGSTTTPTTPSGQSGTSPQR